MFRLGNRVTFRLVIECTGIKKSILNRDLIRGQQIPLVVTTTMGGDAISRIDALSFPQPTHVGDRNIACLPPLFLEVTGDAKIYIDHGNSIDTLYTFKVWEPAEALFVWFIGLVGTAIGIGLGVLITWFAT